MAAEPEGDEPPAGFGSAESRDFASGDKIDPPIQIHDARHDGQPGLATSDLR
jgi:hypothetical protein